jgi:hypothetical protein
VLLAAMLGILVGLAPLTGVVGSSRLLVVPAMIVCAVCGRLVVDLTSSAGAALGEARRGRLGRSPATRIVAWGPGIFSLAAAAALLARAGLEGYDTHLRAEWMAGLDGGELQRWQHPGLRELSGRDVIVVSAPDSYTAIFGTAVLAERIEGRPRRVHTLTQTGEAILLRRSKPQRLSLDILGGGFDLRDPLEPLFWRAPLSRGEAVAAGPLHVRVGAVNAHGAITRLDISFASRVPLHDAALVIFEAGRFVPVAMPPVGGQVIVPARGGRAGPSRPR